MDESHANWPLILGSGRSGTTWVLDCVANANNLRPIFEPLHPAESEIGLKYAYEALMPMDQNEPLEEFFRTLMAGRVRSRWMDYRGRRDRLFPNPFQLMEVDAFKNWIRRWRKHIRDQRVLGEAVRREGVVIKCIRANLMAGWLTRHVGFRTVLIVRHPGAVVESQYRLGGSRLGTVWDPTPVTDRYRRNNKLHEVTGGRYVRLLNSPLTTLEALTLNWIIENQWPVERSKEDDYGIIFYEDLVSEPASSWQTLCDMLGVTQLPNLKSVNQPSQQASGSGGYQGEKVPREPRWRSNLTPEQLDCMQRVLDATECDLYRVSGNTLMHSDANAVRCTQH